MVGLDRRITWADVEAEPRLLMDWQSQDWLLEKSILCYDYQKKKAKECPKPLLNAACGPDPAGIGAMGATNLDIQSVDSITKTPNDKLPNFTHGTVFDMPFSDEAFASAMLGEFLEHCTEERARAALKEVRRVLFPNGTLIVTVPLDGRPFYEQSVMNPGDKHGEYCPGVTNYHQTWWSNRMLDSLARDSGFEEVERSVLIYPMTAPITGWGLLWRKK